MHCRYIIRHSNARILKAHSHSHSMSGSSIWASLACHCCFWIAGGLVSYLTMWLLTLQLFKKSIDTQEKLRLNLHSLSASDLLEYRRKASFWYKFNFWHFVKGFKMVRNLTSPINCLFEMKWNEMKWNEMS
jgi:hypothetical protein